MKTFLKQFAGSDRGASMVEYGLMVALIAMIAVPAVAMVGHDTEDTFNTVAGSLASQGPDGGEESPPPGDEDTPAAPGDDDAAGPGDDDDAAGPGDDDDAAGPGGEDDPSPADPGSEAVVASNDSSFYWWNDSKHGGNGAWKAAVEYQNDHNRHQYLTLEITRVDAQGGTTTSTVTGFYVPANGGSTYELWDNSLTLHKGKTSGVVSVEVKVTSVTTSDQNWQPVTYLQHGNATTVDAPKP